MASVALVDHSKVVGNFFGSIRLTSTFLTGASFGGIFSFPSTPSGSSSNSSAKKDMKLFLTLRTIHNIFIVISFLFAINVMFISTIAITKSFEGGFNKIAESGYMLLIKEFEYEFLSARLGYFLSLFSFLIAATCRMLVQFKLIDSGSLTRTGFGVLCLMVGFMMQLLSNVNSNLYTWDNIFDMILDYLKLGLRYNPGRTPLMTISFLLIPLGSLTILSSLFQSAKNAIHHHSSIDSKISP